MAARRTYEQRLLDDLRAMPHTRWFKCKEPPEYDKFVKHVKIFIDCGEPFEFNEDYSKVRRIALTQEPIVWPVYHKMKKLPPGIEVVVLEPGEMIEFEHKGQTRYVERTKKAYSIRFNGKEFCIES